MSEHTVDDLPTMLRVRCTAGRSDERDLVCRAADEIERLRGELRRITALDPTRPIGEPPDPFFFIRQAQGIAAAALSTSDRGAKS